MIGERTIKIGDKDVNLRFDWGAVEDFCENEDVKFSEFDTALDSPKKMRSLIYHMAQSGGSDIKADELRKLSFTQMGAITELISESMSEGKEEKPKK